MTKGGCPCRGCEERSVECHAKCERYGAWKAEHDRERKAAFAVRDMENKLDENAIKRKFKAMMVWKKKGRGFK